MHTLLTLLIAALAVLIHVCSAQPTFVPTPSAQAPTYGPTQSAFLARINLFFTGLYAKNFAANSNMDLALRQTVVLYSGFSKQIDASAIATPVDVKDTPTVGCTITLDLTSTAAQFSTYFPAQTIQTYLANSTRIIPASSQSAFVNTFISLALSPFPAGVVLSSVGVVNASPMNLSPSPVASPQAGTLAPTPAFVLKDNGDLSPIPIAAIAGIIFTVVFCSYIASAVGYHVYRSYYPLPHHLEHGLESGHHCVADCIRIVDVNSHCLGECLRILTFQDDEITEYEDSGQQQQQQQLPRAPAPPPPPQNWRFTDNPLYGPNVNGPSSSSLASPPPRQDTSNSNSNSYSVNSSRRISTEIRPSQILALREAAAKQGNNS